ncbi:hypothetical protein N7507_010015 [Penicillium longicatenatum]|nr:hypothetical protein N7507_010015 [Penicillium longicatenatum]
MPQASKLQICKEVLDLFVLVIDHEESPLRSSRSSSLDQAEVIDLPALFKSEPRRTQESSGVDGPSMTSDFNTIEWTRQRRLLDRELRRLLKWDLAFHYDEGKTRKTQTEYDSQTTKKAETLLYGIGETLGKLLRDDLHLDKKVDRIRYLSKNDCSTEISTENVSENESYNPLEAIQTAINSLFELLHPLKRKRSIPLSHLIPDLASLDSRPSKITARQGEKFQVHSMGDINRNEILRAGYPQSRRRVQFSLGDLDARSSAEEPSSSDTTPLTTFGENEQSQEMRGGQRVNETNQDSSTENKIIVKIADSPDAFRKASHDTKPSSTSSTTEIAKPQIRRVFSSEVPAGLFSDIDLKDPTLLSERFENLSLVYTQFSPAAITDRLCYLARVEKTPIQYFKSDGLAGCQILDPVLSKPLYRLESIQALILGLPDWQVSNRPEEAHHSRSAVSMIYFSLLEEVFTCAVEFSRILQMRFEVNQKVGSVKHDLRMFCACIRQLSELNEGVDSQFQTFQPQLRRVIEKIEILDSKISPDSAAELKNVDSDGEAPSLGSNTSFFVEGHSSCNSASVAKKSGFSFPFFKCRPLSLACFLSSSDDIPIELSEDEVSGDFVTLKVRDLFK